MPSLPAHPSSDPVRRSTTLRNTIITVGLCLIAAFWIALYGMVALQRDVAVDQARRDVANLSLVFEEQIVRSLNAIDQAMLFLKGDHERAPAVFSLSDWLRRSPSLAGITLQLALIGADGRLTASSLDPRPDPVDLSDREHFRVHVDRDTGLLFIGTPVLGRVSGKWSIQLSRRLNNSDGSFAGVVVASVDPTYLTRFYEGINVGRYGNTTLVGLDGIVRARAAQSTEGHMPGLGESLLNSPLFRHLIEAPSGIYISKSSLDGTERVRSYRTVRSYPLVVVVGKALDEVLAGPRQTAERIYLVAGGVTVLLAALMAVLALEIDRRSCRERDLATERRKLKHSEERLRFALECASAGIWDWDIDGGTLVWSDECCRLYGLLTAAGPVTLQDWLGLIHPEDRPAFEQAARGLAEGRATHFHSEFRVHHVDRGWYWLAALGRISHGGDGAARDGVPHDGRQDTGRRIAGLTIDINERKKAEHGLLAAKQEAEQAARTKADFLASMSHEIRTPMNGIIGYATFLDDLATSDEQRHYARQLREAGQVLLTIINDILDFSKLEAGKLAIDTMPFRLAETLDGIVALIQPSAAGKRLELRVSIAQELPRVVVGDPGRLRQVLLNLLSNAVKFTSDGHVTVSVLPVPDGAPMVKFLVTDTGIGIPADKLPLLFEKFSQADQSISREYGGTGLGLAICKRLVQAMGGTIGVHSVVDVGSTFWFTVLLPGSAEPLPLPSAAPSPVAAGAPRHAGRLLLVEDVEMNQELATRMLRAAGHEVAVAGNGAEAVAAVQEGDFDLVLMDVQMPVMDGLEATRAIRALEGPAGRVPIIAMTAGALPEEVARCREAGMNDLLTKPIDRSALLAAVARWLAPFPPPPVSRPIPGRSIPCAPVSVGSQPVLDEAVIGRHCQEIGADTTRDLLAMFRTNLRKHMRSAELEPVDWTALGRDAHSVVSLAGSLGFTELMEASRSLCHACKAPDQEAAGRLIDVYRAAAARAQETAEFKLHQLEARLETASVR